MERETLKGPPDYAKPFPDVQPGDILWSGALYEGFCRVAVVSKCERDTILCVLLDYYGPGSLMPKLFWGETEQRTLAEAVRTSAESDIKYHSRQLAYAKAVLAAIESGSSCEEFIDGYPDERDEED